MKAEIAFKNSVLGDEESIFVKDMFGVTEFYKNYDAECGEQWVTCYNESPDIKRMYRNSKDPNIFFEMFTENGSVELYDCGTTSYEEIELYIQQSEIITYGINKASMEDIIKACNEDVII